MYDMSLINNEKTCYFLAIYLAINNLITLKI